MYFATLASSEMTYSLLNISVAEGRTSKHTVSKNTRLQNDSTTVVLLVSLHNSSCKEKTNLELRTASVKVSRSRGRLNASKGFSALNARSCYLKLCIIMLRAPPLFGTWSPKLPPFEGIRTDRSLSLVSTLTCATVSKRMLCPAST